MTGPEHYREAEERLRTAGGQLGVAIAQVHATLAFAAAFAELRSVGSRLGRDGNRSVAWQEAFADDGKES